MIIPKNHTSPLFSSITTILSKMFGHIQSDILEWNMIKIKLWNRCCFFFCNFKIIYTLISNQAVLLRYRRFIRFKIKSVKCFTNLPMNFIPKFKYSDFQLNVFLTISKITAIKITYCYCPGICNQYVITYSVIDIYPFNASGFIVILSWNHILKMYYPA